MTQLATGDISTGSVWNKNSWHWEEKDYNKAASRFIVDCIENVSLSKDGKEIKLENVIPSGFASISVRKGKKVVVFEFSISLTYVSELGTGCITIPEFSNDELHPAFRVTLDSGDESLKNFMRLSGTESIQYALDRFIGFMNAVETGDDLVEADRKRRDAELAEAIKAEDEKGNEKQKIADSVKEKEREALAGKTFVEASVWNPNSYHWETRKLDKWAVSWIQTQLKGESFQDVSVEGEAENSIRKGKKIAIFNLKISGKFRGVEFHVPSFSNEAGDEELPRVNCDMSVKDDLSQSLSRLVFVNFLSQLNLQ